MQLDTLGWGPALAAAFDEAVQQLSSSASLSPGRIVRQDRGAYRVQTSEGLWLARPSGRLRHEALHPEALPVVGDWVVVSASGADSEALIHAVLPRRSLLSRREVRTGHAGQAIASNVDVVFLVVALDAPPNLRRLERALTVAWSSGASPVVVLSKADMCPDVAGALQEVSEVATGAPVVVVSAVEEASPAALREHLGPGRTGVLLGASGVGKSTLINRLLGEERLSTSAVREDDRKGRHTTTHRELVPLPDSGGLLIDSPGTRELGLWADEDEGLATAFADIEALAADCRFRDCSHQAEPGCAVQRAVEEGVLAPERLHSFAKLQRELAHARREVDALARREYRRFVKGREREARESVRLKRS